MKKYILLGFICLSGFGFSQVSPIDFETGGEGANWTWTVFEAAANPMLNVIPNPVSGGINTSSTVAEMTMDASGESWGGVGCESMHGADIGAFAVTTSNSTVKMMIYQVGFAAPVALKFATSTNYALFETIVTNSVADQWVEVEFDMSAWIGDPNGLPDQIIFFPSYGPRGTGHTVYFDNIDFGEASSGANEPMVAAPDPIIPEANVISMFSGVYTDVPVDTWNTAWSAAAYQEVMIANNPTKKYTSLNFNGIETVGTPIDASASGMEYIHIDVWTPNSTAFRIKLVDFLGDGFQGTNGDTEAELSFVLDPEQWVSLHIPLSDFTSEGMTAFSDLNQLIISSDPAGASIVYVDNVYFSTQALSVDEFEFIDMAVYPNPSENTWTIRTNNQVLSKVEVFDVLGKQIVSIIPHSTEIIIDASYLPKGLYFAKMYSQDVIGSVKLIRK